MLYASPYVGPSLLMRQPLFERFITKRTASLVYLRCFAFRLLSHSARSSSSLPLNSASSSLSSGTSSRAPWLVELLTLMKSPAFWFAYSCFWMSSRSSVLVGSTSWYGVRRALFLTRVLEPASSIISTMALPKGRWAGGSEFIHLMTVWSGVSPSRVFTGSHSNSGWSRR